MLNSISYFSILIIWIIFDKVYVSQSSFLNFSINMNKDHKINIEENEMLESEQIDVVTEYNNTIHRYNDTNKYNIYELNDKILSSQSTSTLNFPNFHDKTFSFQYTNDIPYFHLSECIPYHGKKRKLNHCFQNALFLSKPDYFTECIDNSISYKSTTFANPTYNELQKFNKLDYHTLRNSDTCLIPSNYDTYIPPNPLFITNIEKSSNDGQQSFIKINQSFDYLVETLNTQHFSSNNTKTTNKYITNSNICVQNNPEMSVSKHSCHISLNYPILHSYRTNYTSTKTWETNELDTHNLSMYNSTCDSSNTVFSDQINYLHHDKSNNKLFQNIECTRRSSFANQYKIIHKFILDNHEFTSEFNRLFLNLNSDVVKDTFINKLCELSCQKIIVTKQKLELCEFFPMKAKNSPIFTHDCLKNFCCFCTKNNCTMFNKNFKQSTKHFLFLLQTLKISRGYSRELGIFGFVNKIHQLTQKSNHFDLKTFLSLLMDQRTILFELIQKMQTKKIHLNAHIKKKLIKEIFHNFKCHNSKIKIQLIPEFIHIFFIVLNRELSFYYKHSNTLFLIFIFHMQLFDHIFIVLSQCNLFNSNISENEQISCKIYKKFTSLLLRINFVEPLVILFTRNENAILRYRFHILSLFHINCLAIQNTNHDQGKLKFLEQSIHWIFYCYLHFNSKTFLYIYEKKDMKFISTLDDSYFSLLMRMFNKFKESEAYLNSSYFEKNNESSDIQNFFKLSQEGFTQFRIF